MTHAALLVALVLATGCGPSLGQVAKARSARYVAGYDEVWRAVADVVGEHYHVLKRVDPEHGIIVTEWKLITRKAEGQVRSATSQAGLAHGGDYFQARILIVPGGPPWRIIIQGEGAEHRRDFAMLMPYSKANGDEPVWVEGRVNALYVAIHARLHDRIATTAVAARHAGHR